MPTKFKLALGLAVGGFFFGLGWYSRGEQVRTVEVPKEVVKTEVQTQVQQVDHVVTQIVTKIVKEPSGGTTTTTTKTVAEDKKVDTGRAVERDQQRTEPLAASQANYSVGLGWQPRVDPSAYGPTRVEFGRRLIGPVWGEVGADWRDHSLTVGVRAEW